MSRKEFKITEGNGQEVTLAVRQPQYQDYEEADGIYAVKVASIVRENTGRKKLLLRSQLETFLRENGIWTDEDEKKMLKLHKELEEKLKKLSKGGMKVKGEGRPLAISVMDTRKEIVKIRGKRQVFDDITIESISENERVDYLIYSCTVYAKDGNNYWDSFEDMKNDKTSEAYRKASVLLLEMIYNISPEFEKNLPENKWLKKYGFIDEELNYVDSKTGEKVDRDGRPVKDIQEEIQKQLAILQGDIVEEAPFIDDETGEPVIKEEKEEQTEDKAENNKEAESVSA
jgi:hypothetical protein